MNGWVSVKDRLPETDDPVLIILNTKDQLPLVARFVKQHSGFTGEFKNTWFVFTPPRFPKPWMFSEEYTKTFRLKKDKVSHWIPIPAAPERERQEQYPKKSAGRKRLGHSCISKSKEFSRAN